MNFPIQEFSFIRVKNEVLAFLLCLPFFPQPLQDPALFSLTSSLELLLSRFSLILVLPNVIGTSLPSSHLIDATACCTVNHFRLKTLFLLGHVITSPSPFFNTSLAIFFQSHLLVLHPLLDISILENPVAQSSSSLSLPQLILYVPGLYLLF